MTDLLEFTFANYRSFYEPQALAIGQPRDPGRKPVVGLFGANGSGKTNVARALATLLQCVRHSCSADWQLPCLPFLLLEGADTEPSRFGITFRDETAIYEYGFSYDAGSVIEERLSTRPADKPTAKARRIFHRQGQEYLAASLQGSGFTRELLGMTRPDSLLLTRGFEFNNRYSRAAFDLADSIRIANLDADEPPARNLMLLKDDPELERDFEDIMHACDFAIRGFVREDGTVPDDPADLRLLMHINRITPWEAPSQRFLTEHAVRDRERRVVGMRRFLFDGQESQGTRAFVSIAADVVLALRDGATLYIDEFGNSISPKVVSYIIELFRKRSPRTGATLLFNTQNTAAIESLGFDEVYMVDKGFDEQSHLTPLTAKRGLRHEPPREKRLRNGLYGGVPRVETVSA